MQVWVICPTLDKRVKVEHLISKRTHKPITWRFWVRVWCLSCLCGVLASMWTVLRAPLNVPTVVSEPRSTKGKTEAAGLFAQKAATTVQAVSVCGETSNGDTCKVRAFAWGVAWWIDGLTLEGECRCVQVWVICPTSNKRVKIEHLISKRTHKLCDVSLPCAVF